MPFIYIHNNNREEGDISIIPEEYRDEALLQTEHAIMAHQNGFFCPPVVVDIGKSIMYQLDSTLQLGAFLQKL